jgi:thiamine biosynthesis lipoprotein
MLVKTRVTAIILCIAICLPLLGGCRVKNKYNRYADTIFHAFDTMIQLVAYTETEEEFERYFAYAGERFLALHRLYDIYHNYDGINNLKTINDNAGKAPVKVDREIIDLLLFAKEWHNTAKQTNIAMGAVLKIWHDYRIEGIDFPENAKLPPMELLQKAAAHTDINQVIIDEEQNTVYLADPEMSLDVGAIAKGYATELVARELQADGLTSGVISAGGNIRTIGRPLDGKRKRWNIGIQDPGSSIVSNQGVLDVVYVENASVVSSGDYQRYYYVDGKKYHHLIDPETLMPGAYYHAVTVVADDSGVADFLSTALFLLPYEEALVLAGSVPGVEAIWVMPDGTIRTTPGMKKILKSAGATNL